MFAKNTTEHALHAHGLYGPPMEHQLQQAWQSRHLRGEASDPFDDRAVFGGAEVDPLTGAKIFHPQIDLCLPDPLPFVASRQYTSQPGEHPEPVGLLGPGWRMPHEASLCLGDDVLTLHGLAMQPLQTAALAPGETAYLPARRLWIVRGGREQLETRPQHPAAALRTLWRSLHAQDRRRENFFYVAHHALGPWWIFGPHRESPLDPGQRLRLRVIRDRFGRMLQFGHDPHTGLATIAEDSSGRQFRLELKYFPQLASKAPQDGGVDSGWRLLGVHILKDAHVQEAHPLKPRQPPAIRYEYTSRGELADVYGRAETPLHRFEYHPQQRGLVVSHTRAGRADVGFEYNDAGQLTSQRTYRGMALQFQHEPEHTTVTDSLGRQRTLYFSGEGEQRHAARLKRADGTSVSRTLDAHGRLCTATDATGRITRHERDALTGLLLCARDADGAERHMDYNQQGQLVRMTLRGNVEVRCQYDLLGRITAITDAADRTMRFRYAHDETDLPSLIEDARGRKLQLQWSPENLLTQVTDPAGHVTRIEHDRWGQVLQQKSDGGPLVSNILDSHGRRVSRTVGTQTPTTWQYSAAGELICLRAPDESTLLVDRDEHGRVLAQHAAGMRCDYRYDQAGRLIALAGSKGINGAKGAAMSFAYDTMDRLIGMTLADGRTLRFHYNAAGELLLAPRAPHATQSAA